MIITIVNRNNIERFCIKANSENDELAAKLLDEITWLMAKNHMKQCEMCTQWESWKVMASFSNANRFSFCSRACKNEWLEKTETLIRAEAENISAEFRKGK